MYVAMEQQQSRFNRIGTAAAGACCGTRSDAMSTHQDLIPGHLREFKISSKKGLLYRGSHKVFRQELSMSIPEELSDKHECRASSRS
jgi:hypothetical protein